MERRASSLRARARARVDGGLSTANDKLLDILNALGAHCPHLALSELARLTGLSKASLSRVLRVAERRQYVHVMDGDKYTVGLPLLMLGYQVLAGSRLRALAMPLLMRLSEGFDTAANLVIPRWPHVLLLERVIPPRLHATFSPPGRLAPFYATATGKALAAFQPPHIIDDLMNRPRVALTERTITEAQKLRAALGEARQRGWALDEGELRVGVRCVAAPVRDGSGAVVATMGLSSTGAEELTDHVHIRSLLDAANTLSGLLGYA